MHPGFRPAPAERGGGEGGYKQRQKLKQPAPAHWLPAVDRLGELDFIDRRCSLRQRRLARGGLECGSDKRPPRSVRRRSKLRLRPGHRDILAWVASARNMTMALAAAGAGAEPKV